MAFMTRGSPRSDPGADAAVFGYGDSRDVTFTYTAIDNDSGESTQATTTITVTRTNDVPVAVDATENTAENTTLTGNVPPASDGDGTLANFSLGTDVS